MFERVSLKPLSLSIYNGNGIHCTLMYSKVFAEKDTNKKCEKGISEKFKKSFKLCLQKKKHINLKSFQPDPLTPVVYMFEKVSFFQTSFI